jgi:hypothetical protein
VVRSRKLFSPSRRAQLDVQFNWIFILIAGAVILGLFFKVASTQRQLSEDKSAIRLMTDFDAITKAALQSRDTIQKVQLPSIGLHFECPATCGCQMLFGRFPLAFGDSVIFAPPAVEGTEARLWVLDWRVPFRVTNMLYITNPETHLYLVYDDSAASQDLLDRLRKLMPAEIDYDAISIDGLQNVRNENYARVHFVFLGMQQSLIPVAARYKGTAIRGVSVLADGRLVFSSMGTRGETTQEEGYAGDEMLMGAIMAGDALTYHCNALTAFTRLAGVASVYQERASELEQGASSLCKPLLARIVNGESGKKPPFVIMTEEGLGVVQGGPILKAAGAVSEASLRLYTINEQLLRKSCPTVY